ncbi:hypothetical protein LTR53_015638 [Teratosphaeriaceae sp. CCFEE 6253]|nr:hypothetical protein LTR53_015638 [Teratosphaeriaceae sp. CCFEE 6253]
MQNPSQGLQAPLQNHVHLISGHRFPIVASLDINQALTYLLDAPTIVKTVAPMSWTYVQAPPDGMLWLEWLPPDKPDGRLPSDGFVWADPEVAYRHDFRGYTIEALKHSIGYRMNYDQMASHARTRFHIVAKNPSVNAAPPDPALWLIHYHLADHGRILPSSQVPFAPQMQQIMQERKWLEMQGTLQRRDFMLHDRQSWPQITVPTGGRGGQGMQQQGMYGLPAPQAGPQRFPAYYPQQAGQQPPAKRQRPNPPATGASSEGLHDMSIEEEENTTHGDFFDHLTSRDIAITRYTQHHRWMEEVFSSPYASGQIVPTDLGLGLMGELKGLTDGILAPPGLETGDKPLKPREAQPFTNLSRDQLAEFDKRVAKHLAEGQAEIERMKTEHAARMAGWKRSKTLLQAEKRLRGATWEGHESAMPAFRFEDAGSNGAAEEGGKKETVEGVVREVEELLGVKISAKKEAVLIERGGLEVDEEAAPPQPQSQAETQAQMLQDAQRVQQRMLGAQQQQQGGGGGGVAQQQPAMYHPDPSSVGLPPHPQQQQQQPQQMQRGGQPYAAPMQAQAQAQDAAIRALPPQAPPPGMTEADEEDAAMMDDEDMGLDVGDSQVDFGDDDDALDATADGELGDGKTAMPPPPTTQMGGTADMPAAAPLPLPASSLQPPATSSFPPEARAGGLAAADADGGAVGGGGGGEDALFSEDIFGVLTHAGDGEGLGGNGEGEGDGEGEAEAGFELMDESAFGEATYGMEGEEGQGP